MQPGYGSGMTWRTKLEMLIRDGQYRKQSDLVAALSQHGLAVTQSSVSRELTLRGVEKVNGFYALPSERLPPAPIHRVAFTNAGCLGVIHTDPAFASVVGQFIDGADLPSVLGTVCGDDTVFVALREGAGTEALLGLLGWENL